MVNIGEVLSSKPRILIADDDDDLRLTLCEYLETCNFAISSASNGNEAIGAIQSRKHAFDIIFTDLMMPPGPDGMQVLRAAKHVNPLSCVVVMTGYCSIGTAIESIRSGAFDYLTKPFKLAEIEILATRILDYLALIGDNKRLSSKLALVAEKSASIDLRLEKIEALLTTLLAKAGG